MLRKPDCMFSRAFCLIIVLCNCLVVTARGVRCRRKVRFAHPPHCVGPLTRPRTAMPFDSPRPPGSLRHGYVRRGRRQRSVPARSGASQFARRAPPPTGHETMTEDQTVTQAAVVGTQAANCGAPERTRPTY